MLTRRLHLSDIAIDATMGNGHDTVFLAKAVGVDGTVYAFDPQPEAVESTRQQLELQQLSEPVKLLPVGHQTMLESVAATDQGKVRVVMFNLGYRPGGDKRVTTHDTTTMMALNAALKLIAPDGLISIIAYPGHPNGLIECEAVKKWARALPADRYQRSVTVPAATRRRPPEWIVVSKRFTP